MRTKPRTPGVKPGVPFAWPSGGQTVYEILRGFRRGWKRPGTGCTLEGKCVSAGLYNLLSDHKFTVFDGHSFVAREGLLSTVAQLDRAALHADFAQQLILVQFMLLG